MEKRDPSQYRPSVGICLLNHQNQIFVGHRIDTKTAAWQMPQGGIDDNENILDTAKRELKEETNITSIEILKTYEDWLYYDFPKALQKKLWKAKYIGQKQKWILARFIGNEHEIDLQTHHPEFKAWQWMDSKEILKQIVPFKKELYLQVFQAFNL